MSTAERTKLSRFGLLSWLLIPAIAVWLTTNYLVATFHKPLWTTNEGSVLGAKTIIDNSINQSGMWDKNSLATLWFDNSSVEQYRTVLPILSTKNLPAVLTLDTNTIGTKEFVNWAQIKKLQFEGWELTPYLPKTACTITKENQAEFELQLLNSKRDLELRGIPTNVFVDYCGVNSLEKELIIEKYYLAKRGALDGINPLPLQDFYNLRVVEVNKNLQKSEIDKILDDVKKDKEWVIFLINDIEEEKLKTLVNSISERQIKTVTPTWVLNSVR